MGVLTGGASGRDLLAVEAHGAYDPLYLLEARADGTLRALAASQAGDTSIDVMVEVPARTRINYGADSPSERTRLDRLLTRTLAYPADFGFVPGTLSDAGDTLDALVILDDPVVPWTIVRASPLGLIWVGDEKVRDPKLITVLSDVATAERLTDLSDLPRLRLEEFEQFFQTYKGLSLRRATHICGYGDRGEAWEEIDRSRTRARVQHERTQGSPSPASDAPGRVMR